LGSHERADAISLELVEGERRSFGDRVADKVSNAIGTWRLALGVNGVMLAWVAANSIFGLKIDPPPFLGLNTAISVGTLMETLVLGIAIKRQTDRDRHRAVLDAELARHHQEELQTQAASHREELKLYHTQLMGKLEELERQIAARDAAPPKRSRSPKPRKQ
jgi:uncharacterized membrane protein